MREMSSGHKPGAAEDGGVGGRERASADATDVYTLYALHGGERLEEVLEDSRGMVFESHLPLGPNGERVTADGVPHKTGIWTETEDELLYVWQQRIGNKWAEVAKHIPGKTG